MLKMKLPKQAVLNKMKQDGIAINIMQKFELTGQLPAGLRFFYFFCLKLFIFYDREYIDVVKGAGGAAPAPAPVSGELPPADPSLINKFFGGKGPKAPGIGKPAKTKWPENLKRKPEIKPSRKMKNLQWSKIDPFSVENSIWTECDDSKINFDEKELEAMFGQKIMNKKAGSGT